MKALFITLIALNSFLCASAQKEDKVTELEQRVKRLEYRLARMEKGQALPDAKKMMITARKKDADERRKYSAADIAKAEELYQQAANILSEDASKKLLDSVVSVYPQLNRAGCAQLYRARQETGPEKERLLKDCIARFSNCYYFDGTQVGPLAMLQLAEFYQESGREQDARKLFKQLRKESPEAVGHDGELLLNKID